ncbi:hypothetical protein Tco_0369838 [Tanacetum coccineum]
MLFAKRKNRTLIEAARTMLQYIITYYNYGLNPKSSEDAVADDAGKKKTNEKPANEGERSGQEKERSINDKER